MNSSCRQRGMVLVLFVIFVGLLLPVNIRSEVATSREMEQVCQNWLIYMVAQHGSWAGSTSPQIAGVEDIIVNDTVIGKKYSISPSGYVVVPVLKELPPIKLSSETSELVLTNSEGMGQLIKDVLHDRVRMFVEAYGSMEISQPTKGTPVFDAINKQQWDYYNVSLKTFQDNLNTKVLEPMTEVGPLLTTSWHQGDPYNQLCPIGYQGYRCVVGCVATAAAQIIAYHQWPPFGYGDYSYYWGGDYSCTGGYTGGATLSADFSDPYDWDNMADNCHVGCTPEEQQALSELCYEVGIIFEMDYGACGSGVYPSDVPASMDRWAEHLRYRNSWNQYWRSSYNSTTWFTLIQDQINQNQPIEYYITAHAIVCDGWRDTGGLRQYHMNYGWDDGHTTWYTLDNYYCPVENCDQLNEFMITDIVPDKGVMLAADTTVGWAPFSVQFTGTSEYNVASCLWDFGDGETDTVMNPVHTYNTPGLYDVSFVVDTGGDTLSIRRTEYILVFADTLVARDTIGAGSSSAEMVIYGRNTLPLQQMIIPFEYYGTLGMTYDSFSTVGCRTETCDIQTRIHSDPNNKRYTIQLQNTVEDIPAGSGPVLKLYFHIPWTATSEQVDTVELDGYLSYSPLFYGSIAQCNPIPVLGTVSYSCCLHRGNIDGIVMPAGPIDVSDLTYMVDYLFSGGPPPPCDEEGNVDGLVGPSGPIDISDLTYLVAYLFSGGPEPPACP